MTENSKTKIDVLDHGFVRLVSYMQPVPIEGEEYIGGIGRVEALLQPRGWTGDLEVVRNARVSYDADWRESDEQKDSKLINYLYKNGHTSPFEAMVFTFEIKAPIFVLRQWHRHRTWSYNEISARYAKLDEGYYIPDESVITTQSASNKQMRTSEIHPAAAAFQNQIEDMHQECNGLYEELIKNGCPRELARSVLPVGVYSRMFATVDLHNLFHFLRLRLHEHSQYEIRVYAEAMLALIEPVVPEAVKAFKNNT